MYIKKLNEILNISSHLKSENQAKIHQNIRHILASLIQLHPLFEPAVDAGRHKFGGNCYLTPKPLRTFAE